jgi:hypothetical protein
METPATAAPLTVTTHSGLVVLAKLYHGTPYAKTYANRTQARKAAEKAGPGWEVYGLSTPLFVGRSA